MTDQYPKRLIEVDLPIARISAHARREKSIRHGHISTLHIWWARRPLAACRAVICAALWPDPADENCPQAFRDAAAELVAAFAEKVVKGKIGRHNLMKTASPESLARWEAIATSGVPLDPADAAHQNVLRFALLDFSRRLRQLGQLDRAGLPRDRPSPHPVGPRIPRRPARHPPAGGRSVRRGRGYSAGGAEGGGGCVRVGPEPRTRAAQ